MKPLDTTRKIKNFIAKVPHLIDGSKNPRTGAERALVNSFWAEITQSIFDSAYKAYKVKSRGETDDLGIAWADLDKKTKAYYKKSLRKTLTRNQKAKQKLDNRGLLTDSQQKRWRKVYSTQLVFATKNGKDAVTGEMKAIAAGKAWNAVIKAGAETYMNVLGNKTVPIGIESHKIIDSLKPGSISGHKYHKSNKNQVVKRGVKSGTLELGTSVPYAHDFAQRREFLPDDFGAWFDKAVEIARDKLEEIIAKVIS